jgi:hypothetical protein
MFVEIPLFVDSLSYSQNQLAWRNSVKSFLFGSSLKRPFFTGFFVCWMADKVRIMTIESE